MSDDLQVQLSELQCLVAAQADEIARLRADMRRFEDKNAASAPAGGTSGDTGEGRPPGPGPKISRRAFARLGAMAGLGAATAAAAVLTADASPAAAAEGGGVLLGKDNDGATARTGVFATGATLYATLADPDVDIGNTPLSVKTVTAGVVGKGTVGVIGAGSGATGIGMYATDSPLNASSAAGSELCTGLGVWLQGAANENSAIYAQSDGLGDGITVLLTSPSNQQSAVRSVNEGSGPAVWATDQSGLQGFLVPDANVRRRAGTGPGLLAQLGNRYNGSAAVAAHTAGTGPAVEAMANSGSGISASSTTGPAAQLSSTVAHLRLKPGRPATRPKAKQATCSSMRQRISGSARILGRGRAWREAATVPTMGARPQRKREHPMLRTGLYGRTTRGCTTRSG